MFSLGYCYLPLYCSVLLYRTSQKIDVRFINSQIILSNQFSEKNNSDKVNEKDMFGDGMVGGSLRYLYYYSRYECLCYKAVLFSAVVLYCSLVSYAVSEKGPGSCDAVENPDGGLQQLELEDAHEKIK